MKIHHTQIKRAASNGLQLEVTADGKVRAFRLKATGKGYQESETADTPAAAIDAVLSARLARETGTALRGKNQSPVGKTPPSKEDEGLGSESDQPQSGSVVRRRYKDFYKSEGHPDTTGDKISSTLKTFVTDVNPETHNEFLNVKKLALVAKDNGQKLEKWSSKNPGMQRMNLGNVLRRIHRYGADVKIGTVTIPGQNPPFERKKRVRKPKVKSAGQVVADRIAGKQ